MRDIPQSRDEIQLGHHITHYTFLPMVGATLLATASSPVLWVLGYVNLRFAFLIPWISILACCVYVGFLGDYVIPAETYRNVRSGKWGEADE